MENIVEKTAARIEAMMKERADKLQKIDENVEQLYIEIDKQRQRVKEAAAAVDVELYKAEQQKLDELQAQVKTLDNWKRQITETEKVTEAESEKTIAAILEYEITKEAEYKKAAGKLLKELAALTDKHIQDAERAEAVLRSWTSRIRPNYISSGTIYANGTSKSDTPVPVHIVEYHGGDFALWIKNHLERDQGLRAAIREAE